MIAIDTVNHTGEVVGALAVATDLFRRLEEAGVRYCHWKSTCRLAESLRGETDLDLLVDRSQSRLFKAILYEGDFKPFLSHPRRQYPAIEDYLGFDRATGRLVHLHIHYRLILGERYVKNYDLPLEQAFLSQTRCQLGIRVPAPELELIVLTMRALLKYRDQDVARDVAGVGESGGLPTPILDEFAYLLAQTDRARVRRALAQHAPFVPGELILDTLAAVQHAPRDGRTFFRLRRALREALAPYQRYSRAQAQAQYMGARLRRLWPLDRVLARLAGDGGKQKTPIAGGLTVAITGADGAGKSTVVRHVAKWLSWRMNVRVYYMGNSQPSRSTAVVKQAAKIARRAHSGCRRLFGDTSLVTRLVAAPSRVLTYLRHLGDARDRYDRYRAGRRQAALGNVVIFDRYPLDHVEILGQPADGPRIRAMNNGHSGPVARRLARLEEALYGRIQPAEHLVVLAVSPEVSLARKPEHARERIAAKSRAFAQVESGGPDVTRVDADQPLDEVLLQLKRALWDLL